MHATAKTCSPSRRSASTPLRAYQSRRAFLKSSASVLLLSGISSSLLSACGGGNLDTDQPETPRLASVSNFRDVAGAAAGYPTVDGKQMRRSAFYRANALTLSAADTAALDKLGIASVYDLRTPGEIARAADILPAGATSQALDVLGVSDFVAPTFDTAGPAVALIEAHAPAPLTRAPPPVSSGEPPPRLSYFP